MQPLGGVGVQRLPALGLARTRSPSARSRARRGRARSPRSAALPLRTSQSAQPLVDGVARGRCGRPSLQQPAAVQLAEDRGDAARAVDVLHQVGAVRGDLAQARARGARARRCRCIVKSSSASCAAASRCRTVLVEPPIATSSAIAFSNAARVAIARGSTDSSSVVVVAARDVDDRAAGRLVERLARGVRREDRAVAGQRQAERLGQAVHRVRGEHARAGAARRAGGLLDAARCPRRRPRRRRRRRSR